jgi:hypothetical protein
MSNDCKEFVALLVLSNLLESAPPRPPGPMSTFFVHPLAHILSVRHIAGVDLCFAAFP